MKHLYSKQDNHGHLKARKGGKCSILSIEMGLLVNTKSNIENLCKEHDG